MTHSEETKRKQSDIRKQFYSNPIEKEKQRCLMNTPEMKQKISETTKKALSKPEIKRKHIDALNKPEVRVLLSENAKKRFENIEYVKKLRASSSTQESIQKMTITKRRICNEPKFKEKMKLIMNSPEVKLKLVAAAQLRSKDEKYLAKLRVSSKGNKGALGMKRTEEHKRIISNTAKNRILTPDMKVRMCESQIGGFWYGNVRYYKRIECELWKDVNPRVHAWFSNKCVLCEQPGNNSSLIGHHVFYDTKACCLTSKDGKYYSNLNARKHPVKDYYIGENPNYFVILCRSCHGKTNGSFKNRMRYADEFKKMIDEYYGGKCYFTNEEMILLESGLNENVV